MKPILPLSRPLGDVVTPSNFPVFLPWWYVLLGCLYVHCISPYCPLASSSMFCYSRMANLVLRGPIRRSPCELATFFDMVIVTPNLFRVVSHHLLDQNRVLFLLLSNGPSPLITVFLVSVTPRIACSSLVITLAAWYKVAICSIFHDIKLWQYVCKCL